MRLDASPLEISIARCLGIPGGYSLLLGADDDVGRWVCAQLAHAEVWTPGMGVAIGITRAESLVAGVTYFQYNGVNVWTGIAATDPRALSRGTLAKLFEYPFRQLKAKRITALVDASNTRSRRFTERLGFSAEATLEASAADGTDQILYRMRAGDCRWLKAS